MGFTCAPIAAKPDSSHLSGGNPLKVQLDRASLKRPRHSNQAQLARHASGLSGGRRTINASAATILFPEHISGLMSISQDAIPIVIHQFEQPNNDLAQLCHVDRLQAPISLHVRVRTNLQPAALLASRLPPARFPEILLQYVYPLGRRNGVKHWILLRQALVSLQRVPHRAIFSPAGAVTIEQIRQGLETTPYKFPFNYREQDVAVGTRAPSSSVKLTPRLCLIAETRPDHLLIPSSAIHCFAPTAIGQRPSRR